MKSVYFRNFIATILLVLGCFITIGAAFLFLGRSYLMSYTRASLETSAEEVVHAAAALSREQSLASWSLRLTISTIASSTSSHIFVCDENGLVLSCSDLVPFCGEHVGKQLSDRVVHRLVNHIGFDDLTSLDDFYSSRRIVTAEPITSSEGTLGYVFVSSDSSAIIGVWKAFLGVLIAVMIAVLLIAVLCSLAFSKKMAEPLDELSLAARKFALGDFSVRVRTGKRRNDEVGTLLESFNVMADSLEKSEKSRQEFIANVSHELRTPMTTIAGFADGILDGTIPHEQEGKYLRKISDETRRLSRLVRNMLDMSHAESKAVDKSRRVRFDLSELLLLTLLSFEGRAKEKGLDVDPQLPEDPIIVFAERDSITQVLYNLTDNAIKFSQEGSTIVIRLYKRGSKAYISVKNRGETIPPDDLPYIFDRFHKSDRSRSMDKDGVGLGLFLVKKIINAHDEEIAVTSRDGVTEFVFTLPLAPTGRKKDNTHELVRQQQP